MQSERKEERNWIDMQLDVERKFDYYLVIMCQKIKRFQNDNAIECQSESRKRPQKFLPA